MKDGYYLFDGGINYRDDHRTWNELRDGNNVYWEGNLKTRLGYEARMDPGTGFGGAGSTWPSSGMQIIDHIRLETATGSDQYFLAVSMADTAGATNAMGFLVCSGLPSSSGTTFDFIGSSTFTSEGVGQVLPWTTVDYFSWDVFDDKVWMALGDDNPYVLFYDGSSWVAHEYPLCVSVNATGATAGSTKVFTPISETLTGTAVADAQDEFWSGSRFIVAGGGYIYISDMEDLRWAARESGVSPDLGSSYALIADRTSAINGNDTSLDATPGWGYEDRSALESNLRIVDGVAYRKNIFLYGEKGVYNFYITDAHRLAYDKSVETRQRGVYGDIAVTDVGVFWVGKDGIYGYDGYDVTNLGKKIWPQIESEHPTLSTGISTQFGDCSLSYHKNKVWVSFPDGTNKEMYVFDPDLIYADQKGESHAPMYKKTYVASTGRESIGFKKLKEYEGHLYGISSSTGWEAVTSAGYMQDHLYEIDRMGYDQCSAGGGNVGINFDIKTAFMDQDAPGMQKNYRQVIIETNEGLSAGSNTGAYDPYFAAAINHNTGADNRGMTTSGVIDMEFSTGGHAFKTLDIPITTAGYILDGNSISLEFFGETSAVVPTTDTMNFYGFTLNYDMMERPLEEVST